MSIVAIDPNVLRTQSVETKRQTFGVDDFSALVSAATPAATAAVQYNYGYQPAAVTQAAMSGVPTAANSFSGKAPYYTPMASISTLPGGAIDYTQIPNSSGTSGGMPPLPTTPGAPGTVGMASFPTNPALPGYVGSQDFQEKNYLFQKMNDANWEMLTAQVIIQDISKRDQFRSNALKTAFDAEMNAVRNIRG